MSSRTWIKINCDRWFDGTIRKETIEVRSIWTDLLALAGRTGQDGVIRLPGTEVGYSDHQLAVIFNVPIEVWLAAKDRLMNHPGGKPENRILVSSENKIEILNWVTYQSEYVRQKSYREKLQPKVTVEGNRRKCGENRRRLDRDVDLKEQDQPQCAPPKNGRFTIPTVEEISEYCRARNNNVDPLKFHAYYTSNGWRVGKNPMKNWKAAVVSTWEKN
jgi:hypothetical protein